MFDINEDFISNDLDMLSEILNPVEEKTLKFEEGENRVVSILFLDVKGFTAMSESMSSEDVKRTMDKILTAFSNSIIKYGGYIDKYEGDLIMALFGSKITSETDTERAINAGLKILSDLKHINKILNIDLSVRIGINTGEVTTGKVGMKREGDFTVYGDAVNLASRMESNAPLNTIMLPKETKEIVDDYFMFEDIGDIEVKGKEKLISVFKVLSKNPKKVERWERNRSIIKRSTYVGRDKEINEIIGLYNTSKSEIGSTNKDYKPVIIGLKGPAGIGKSRLVKEFIDKVDDSYNTILSGYTRSYAQPAYCIWTTMLKNYFNIEDDDTKENITEKLNLSFENLIEIEGAKQILLEAKNVIGYIFGVKYEDIRLENIDPKALQSLINVSIRHTVETIAFEINKESNKPLVIYFDDCQWMDEPSQSLLKNLIVSINAEEKRENRANKNLLFLLTYRPEFEVFKEFEFDSRFTEFELRPLTTDNSKELIDSMLGKNNIPDPFIEKIMENSAGNPFYIEELVSYLIELEKIVVENNKWIISDEVDKIQIPLSLNSIILSRIDNLNDEFKNILQKASVIGHHFFKTILKEVSNNIDNTDIDKDFSKLVNDNWFYSENDEDKYFFKHILTTNVCYNAILRYNKRILHKIIAETTEDIFKDNKEHFAFVANHYEKSEPEKGSKEFHKMLEYLEKAAGFAKDNYESENAIKLYDTIVSYGISEVKEVEIVLEKAEILELTGQWDEAEIILNTCLEKAVKIKNNQLIAKTYRFLGIISWRIGKNKDAMKFHNKSLEYYKILDDENGISECYGNIGNMFYSESEYSKAMEYYEKKLSICKKLDNKKGFAKAVGNMGIVHWVKEDYKKAMEFFKLDLDMCEKMGDKIGYANTIGNMGLVYSEKYDHVNTMQCYEKKLSICEEIGNKQGVSTVIGSIGLAYESNGEYDKAMECYKKYLKLAEELGDKEGISIALDHVGSIYFEKGKFKESIDCYDRAIELGRELNIKYYLCSYLYFKANAMYMLNDPNAYAVNEEALRLSIEVDRTEGVFLSTVLREKLGFMISDNIEEKKKYIDNLQNLLKVEEDDDKDEDVIAELNYQIALLFSKLNEDISEYKEKSIRIFKKLYRSIPNIVYQKRIEELEML